MKIIIYISFILFNFITYAIANNFSVTPLSKTLQSELVSTGVWQTGCPAKLEDLRLVSVNYYDAFGHAHLDGELILHKLAAQAAANLFKELYEKKFPFTSIQTLVKYHGNRRLAEKENITYGLSCQRELNQEFSTVSLGTTLTMNPILNPEIHFIKKQSISVFPEQGIFSVNRALHLKGMTDPILDVLKKYGFVRPKLSEQILEWKNFIYTDKQNYTLNSVSQLNINNINNNTGTKIFSINELSDKTKKYLKTSGDWKESCPVGLERLNEVNLTYYDFQGGTHTGHLIVLDTIAPFLIHAFENLYENKLPIEPLHDEYTKDTEGTSSFKCRAITGGTSYSLHSFGVAIDINVSRNPYIGSYDKNENDYKLGALIPGEMSSFSYLNRSVIRPGMNENIVTVMKNNAFIEWGGNWQDRIDYMHFQIPTNIAYQIVQMNKETGQQLINLMMKYPNSAKSMSSDSRWVYLYEMQPRLFTETLTKYFALLGTENEDKVIHLIYEDMVMSQHTS
ncbi:MAG: M15 family metallopeptidase [Gammaproteobacteria bacterium]|nr:M15 family metallopeptidase [Gammaproteobacteria bacterium]